MGRNGGYTMAWQGFLDGAVPRQLLFGVDDNYKSGL